MILGGIACTKPDTTASHPIHLLERGAVRWQLE